MGADELPRVLASRPFTVAEGRDAGLRLPDLRTTRLHAPTHGVRTASVPVTLRDRARAFAAGMPSDVAFSHVTAACLLALPLTEGLESGDILDVARASPLTRIRRAGCRGSRAARGDRGRRPEGGRSG